MTELFSLRCRECGRDWGHRASSICEDCLAPLEVKYDLDTIRRTFTRENIASRPANLWRYAELLPLPSGYRPTIPAGMTPLVDAPRLGEKWGVRRLWLKNDAVCFPSLSFKRSRGGRRSGPSQVPLGFQTVSCSSTGNLANAVAAQAARMGFEAVIFMPADLEPAKILGTHISARGSSASPATTTRSTASARRLRSATSGASSTLTCAPITPRAPRPLATKSLSSSAGGFPTISLCPWPVAR